MEPFGNMNATTDQVDKQDQQEFHLNFVDELGDQASPYMPSPLAFCGAEGQEIEVDQRDLTESSSSPPNNLGRIAIPTPPPEILHGSPDSTHSSQSCISIQHSASATSDSYIKGSSLEESPVSSPNSSCAGTSNSEGTALNSFDGAAGSNEVVKRESCIRGGDTGGDAGTSASDGENGYGVSHQQNVPKNIKLPQRKGGMQLWQFLYALLNDPNEKYKKLIEWTANNLSREFRLLEPEAIAIWWGEHKNKKNMSYDKLSRSLRYYYDKGIIRKISGERYVYQFCIDPELMYKHIGNSDSRPKLKPMPHTAYQATTEYQTEHGIAAASMLNREACFIAQDPLSLGIMPGHLLPPRSAYHPPPGYNNGISPFFSHGYTDINAHQTHLGAYSNAFFPSSSYDNLSAIPHMSASLGYPQMEAPLSLKQLPPLRKSNSYEMPSLTPVTHLKYESEPSYGKAALPSNTAVNPISHLKYESEISFGKSPMLLSNAGTQNVILSSHALSPPPLTSNKVASPITPSFPNQGSPLSHSYSNHSSPHTYPVSNDPLGFDDLMPANEYSSNVLTYHASYSSSNSHHSQVAASNTVATPWEEL